MEWPFLRAGSAVKILQRDRSFRYCPAVLKIVPGAGYKYNHSAEKKIRPGGKNEGTIVFLLYSCVGKQLDNINEIQRIDLPDRKRTYMDVSVFPDFFSALYLNDTRENIDKGASVNPVIQFFNWDGIPLAEVKLDRPVTTYAIDEINGDLYTLSYNTDEIYQYDFREVLDKLNEQNN